MRIELLERSIMKRVILITIGLLSAPVFAEPPKVLPVAKNTLIGTSKDARRTAIEDMRGRAQLEMLISRIVEEEELNETHGWGYERQADPRQPG
jgi:hypothetical protein